MLLILVMDINELCKSFLNKDIVLLLQSKSHAIIDNVTLDADTIKVASLTADGKRFIFRFPEDYNAYFKFNDGNTAALACAFILEHPIQKQQRKQANNIKQEKNALPSSVRLINHNKYPNIDFSTKKTVIKNDKNISDTNISLEKSNSFKSVSPISQAPLNNTNQSNIADIGDIVSVYNKDTKQILRIKLDNDGKVKEYDGVSFSYKHYSRFDTEIPGGIRYVQISAPIGSKVYRQPEGYKFTLGNSNGFTHYEILKIAKDNYSLTEKQTVESIIKRRNITELVHFTRIENLPSIIDWGALIPRELHQEAEIKAFYSDEDRIEGRLDCTSISISYPNTGMFYFKRKKASYAVITFDAGFLYSGDCSGFHFFNDNAAASRSKSGNSPKDFELMFSEEGRPSKLPSQYTTTYQAEVLIEGFIPATYIKTIEVENEKDKDYLSSTIGDSFYRKKIVVDKRFFDDNAIKLWSK